MGLLLYNTKNNNIMAHPTTSQTQATLASLVKDFVSYNTWANKTLIAWLKTKPEEVFTKEVASSFPSLRETLAHIWDTERFWLTVMKQVPAPPSFRFQPFAGTLNELFEGALNESENYEAFIHSLSEEQLIEIVSFDTPWVSGAQSRFEFTHHAINHSSYHRGQLITIGRHVGLTDAPMTDYSFYLLRVKQQEFPMAKVA
jgi:uncharacterized damage-inducible protein DinB